MHDIIFKQYAAYTACGCAPDFLMVSIHEDINGNCFCFATGPLYIRVVTGYEGPPILIPKECDNHKINAFYKAVKDYKCQKC